MCGCCGRRRYLVSALGFLGLLVSVGFRTDFSLVMTHITKISYNHTGNATSGTVDSEFIISCPVYNSERDWKVDWSQRTVQLFHTAYFAGSLITQVPGGMLAARFSPKKVCGLMILSSSILFLLLPVLAKQHYGFVFAVRALQGLVEGGSVPALAGVISAWAPRTERTRLLTIAYAGAYISPAVSFLSTGFATCLVSWYSIFYIYGGLGVIWSLVWLCVVHDMPDDCPSLSQEERDLFRQHGPRVRHGGRALARAIPWREILTSRPVLAVFVGAFCRNWIFSMLITQQPQYFKDAFHLTTAEIGLWSALPPLIMTIVVISGGNIFDRLLTSQLIGKTVGRKLAQTIGFGTEAVCILCLYFVNDWRTALTLLCVGVGLSGFAMSGYQVNPLDLSPQFAALITGLGRLGTVGGILSTFVASQVINDHTLAHWKDLWLSAGIIHLVGVVLYDLFASGHVQPWDPSQQQAQAVVVNEYRENDPLLARPHYDDRETWERSLTDSLTLTG